MSIEIENLQSQIAVAMLKTGVSMANIGEVATEGLQKVMGFLAQQNVPIAGAPYLAYKNGNADFSQFDVEMGIPVPHAVAAQGPFFMSQSYGGKAVCGMHKGAYKDIEAVYVALMEYMAANALESTGVYYDYYISNPADTPEAELLTQVVFPIN